MPIHQFTFILKEYAVGLAFLSLAAGHAWSCGREQSNICQERLRAHNRMADIENELARLKSVKRN